MTLRAVRDSRYRLLSLYYYATLRRPKRRGWLPSEEKDIVNALGESGSPVQDLVLSVTDYKSYLAQAGYSSRYPEYYHAQIAEKSLEHFIAQRLLCLNSSDVYIDIASERSPVPEIYHRLYGCEAYAQDLSYPPGIHGGRIGSSADSLPIPDGFASKMALHCSFEHFEGDSDTGFIREAARVLRPGGKLVVVPLYLASRYAIATDLLVSRNRVRFESDALVMAVKDWRNRHGRFYDAEHLRSRVLEQADDLAFSIFRVVNGSEIDETVYARFVLVGTRERPTTATRGESETGSKEAVSESGGAVRPFRAVVGG